MNNQDSFLRDLDSLEPEKYHYFITFLSIMGYFLDGYDLLVIGPALIFITPLNLPQTQIPLHQQVGPLLWILLLMWQYRY